MKYFVLDQFLSVEQCDKLIEISKTRLARATGWDVVSGMSKEDDYRTSEHMFYGRSENDVVKSIEDKISMFTRIPVANFEGLSVIYYRAGTYYKPHYDYFDPAFVGNQSVLARGGQRIITVLMYLNDVKEGGNTYFPNCNVTIKPEVGRALFWYNVLDGNVTIDPSTYHEGQPPGPNSMKWIATLWIRERTFV